MGDDDSNSGPQDCTASVLHSRRHLPAPKMVDLSRSTSIDTIFILVEGKSDVLSHFLLNLYHSLSTKEKRSALLDKSMCVVVVSQLFIPEFPHDQKVKKKISV